MYFVYVLHSLKTGCFYTGHTADLEQRIGQHNRGISRSTRRGIPWELMHWEPFDSRAAAMQREKELKSGKGREEIRRLLVNTQARSAG